MPQTIKQKEALHRRKWQVKTGFQTELDIRKNGRVGTLLAPLIYITKAGLTIEVPAAFVTDFASVPRLFWNIFPPWGKYSKAAVVHDYLYVIGGCTRAYADYIFLEAMEVLGVNICTRRIMYSAVRAGGWIYWNRNRENDDT